MAKEERVNWAGRINSIRKDFIDFCEMSMRSAAMQLELIDILIDQLQNHELFSTIMHKEGTNSYRIALSKTKYPNSNIEIIRVNFNRFNMSLMCTDGSGDWKCGTYRYRTLKNKPVNCTLTSQLHWATTDDENMINELSMAFYETERIYEDSEKKYHEFNNTDEVNLDIIKFVDLCTRYTNNVILSGKLSRTVLNGIQLGLLTAREFYEKVDLNELKKAPNIGPKSISIIKQIYRFYGLSESEEL